MLSPLLTCCFTVSPDSSFSSTSSTNSNSLTPSVGWSSSQSSSRTSRRYSNLLLLGGSSRRSSEGFTTQTERIIQLRLEKWVIEGSRTAETGPIADPSARHGTKSPSSRPTVNRGEDFLKYDGFSLRTSGHDEFLVCVDSVKPLSSADQIGLHEGALVLAIEDKTVKRQSLEQVLDRLAQDNRPCIVRFMQYEVQVHVDKNPYTMTEFPRPQGHRLPGMQPFVEELVIREKSESNSSALSTKDAENLMSTPTGLRGRKNSMQRFWMSDRSTKQCYSCERPFTLCRRRHHCRSCGQIFCAKCCSKLPPRPQIAGQEPQSDPYGWLRKQLVCRMCIDQLENGFEVNIPVLATDGYGSMNIHGSTKHRQAISQGVTSGGKDQPNKLLRDSTIGGVVNARARARKRDRLLRVTQFSDSFLTKTFNGSGPLSPSSVASSANATPSTSSFNPGADDLVSAASTPQMVVIDESGEVKPAGQNSSLQPAPPTTRNDAKATTNALFGMFTRVKIVQTVRIPLPSESNENSFRSHGQTPARALRRSSSAPDIVSSSISGTKFRDTSSSGTSSSSASQSGTTATPNRVVHRRLKRSNSRSNLDHLVDDSTEPRLSNRLNRSCSITNANVDAIYDSFMKEATSRKYHSERELLSTLHQNNSIVNTNSQPLDVCDNVPDSGSRSEVLSDNSMINTPSVTSSTSTTSSRMTSITYPDPSEPEMRPSIPTESGTGADSAGKENTNYVPGFSAHQAMDLRLGTDAVLDYDTPDIVQEKQEIKALMRRHAEAHMYELIDFYLHSSPVLVAKLSVKELKAYKDIIHTFSLRAAKELALDRAEGDEMDLLCYVRRKFFPNGKIEQSSYIDGVIYHKSLSRKTSKPRVTNPRILLVASPLDSQRQYGHIASLESVESAEAEYLHLLVEKIMTLKPDIVLFGGHVDRLAETLLVEHGVLVVKNANRRVMQRIARCTGAMLLSSPDHVDKIAGEDVIGTCREFRAVTYEEPLQTTVNSGSSYPPKPLNLPPKIQVTAPGKKPRSQQKGVRSGGLLGKPQSNKENLQEEEIGDFVQQQQQHRVVQLRRTKRVKRQQYLVFEGGIPGKGCTICLRGNSEEILTEVWNVLARMIRAAYNMRLQRSCLSDFLISPPPGYDPVRSQDRSKGVYGSIWFGKLSSSLYLYLPSNSLTLRQAMLEKRCSGSMKSVSLSPAAQSAMAAAERWMRSSGVSLSDVKEKKKQLVSPTESKSVIHSRKSESSLLSAMNALDTEQNRKAPERSSEASSLGWNHSSDLITCEYLREQLTFSMCWSKFHSSEASRSELKTIHFYSSNDCTLGQFLMNICFDQWNYAKAAVRNANNAFGSSKTGKERVGSFSYSASNSVPAPGTAPSSVPTSGTPSASVSVLGSGSVSGLSSVSVSESGASAMPAPPPVGWTRTMDGNERKGIRRAFRNRKLTFSCDHGRVTLAVKSLMCDQHRNTTAEELMGIVHRPTLKLIESKQILMWAASANSSKKASFVSVMSKDTMNYSFGKFLEDLLYARNLSVNPANCPHLADCPSASHPFYIRFFSYAGYVATFTYEEITPVMNVVMQPTLWNRQEIMPSSATSYGHSNASYALALPATRGMVRELRSLAEEVVQCTNTKISQSLEDFMIADHTKTILLSIQEEVSRWHRGFSMRLSTEAEAFGDIFLRNSMIREMYLKAADWGNRISESMQATVKFRTKGPSSSPKGALPRAWFGEFEDDAKSPSGLGIDEWLKPGSGGDNVPNAIPGTGTATATAIAPLGLGLAPKRAPSPPKRNELADLAAFAKQIARGGVDFSTTHGSASSNFAAIFDKSPALCKQSSENSTSATLPAGMSKSALYALMHPGSINTTTTTTTNANSNSTEQDTSGSNPQPALPSTSTSFMGLHRRTESLTDLTARFSASSNESQPPQDSLLAVSNNGLLNSGSPSLLGMCPGMSPAAAAAVAATNYSARTSSKNIRQLGYFALPSKLLQWHPSLAVGIENTVVLVNTDQITSVVAYSLCSKEYTKCLNGHFQREGVSRLDRMTAVEYVYTPSSSASCSKSPTNSYGVGGMVQSSPPPSFGAGGNVPSSSPSMRNRSRATTPTTTPSSSFIQPDGSPCGSQLRVSMLNNYRLKGCEKEALMLMVLRSKQHSKIEHSFVDETHFQKATKFRCVSYFAMQFHALRRLYYGGDRKYVESLCHCDVWHIAGGKSGAGFMRTQDERFIAKAIPQMELQMFKSMAEDYFTYMAEAFECNSPTMLSKVLGVYEVNVTTDKAGEQNMIILIMENLTYGRKINHLFDLKGKMEGRYKETQTSLSIHEAHKPSDEPSTSSVLWDRNFVEMNDGIPLPVQETAISRLMTAIDRDTKFLASVQVTDYSMLIGYDIERQELVASIIDYIHKYDFLKMMEHAGKRLIQDEGEITVLSPKQYRRRFCYAMKKYFTAIPSRYTHTVPVPTVLASHTDRRNDKKTEKGAAVDITPPPENEIDTIHSSENDLIHTSSRKTSLLHAAPSMAFAAVMENRASGEGDGNSALDGLGGLGTGMVLGKRGGLQAMNRRRSISHFPQSKKSTP